MFNHVASIHSIYCYTVFKSLPPQSTKVYKRFYRNISAGLTQMFPSQERMLQCT